jgi:hypothetical protein
VPVEVFEKFESRRSTKANQASQSSAELGYIVRGTADDLAARTAAQAASPATYDTLPRQTIQIEPIGPQLWDVTVRYSQNASTGTSTPSESSFTFETGGGTQHITQSLQTVQRRPAPGTTAPDFGGAIGVTADGVEGVDITVPVYQFSETHYFTDAQVTASYKGAIFSCTGKTNAGSFRGFAAGEVLFLGATGSKRGDGPDDDWEITFRFAASPNQTNLTVGHRDQQEGVGVPVGPLRRRGRLWVRRDHQETHRRVRRARVRPGQLWSTGNLTPPHHHA